MVKKNQSVLARKKSRKAKKLAKLALLAGAIYGAKKLWDAQKKNRGGAK